ncbi:HD domain-containing phosphohydrolase [Nitriliruptor alkaliphilus]|uniref:HD domain-containing phosphohydrolase n=1 Tax=Nitriliruptor alkaliphilus TaxID=427918 RepID=UPI000697984C|nr:HD domain-containing phosphohydrolase [Nitriliruptor alkaliphilus]
MPGAAAGDATSPEDLVRTAEVIASLCLATDLGMGFPFEHGLAATLTTMRLCDALGVDAETAKVTYYVSLLMYSGCTVDGQERAGIFGGSLTQQHTHRQHGSQLESLVGIARALPSPEASLPRRTYQVATRLPRARSFALRHFNAFCEVAGMLAERLGLPESVAEIFPYLSERWDGASMLSRAEGADIPLPLRITQVGRDATYQRLMADDDDVVETIKARSGRAFDPAVVDAFLADAPEVLGPAELEASVWDVVLAAEPGPMLMLGDGAVDRALWAMGAFSDTASPYLTGHSTGVGELACRAAAIVGMDETDATTLRRAGYLHDLGRAAVDPRVWAKAGPLSPAEWEQVRLHPYHTERVLVRSPFLAPYARIAGAHHERLDASGYHRGVDAAALPRAARLLAAADAYRCKTEPRPYREAFTPAQATQALATRAEAGGLDVEMVMAVAEAADQRRPQIRRPAGLTDREVEVIGLLAHGKATKQIAASLSISAKTADRHIQNIYGKIGVSSRAAATLYAAEHGLVS